MSALLRILITTAAILPSATAIADDAFMAIHMDNQKIGSAVAIYWQAYSAVSAQDGQTAIRMDYQKFISTVVAFWRTHRTSVEQPIDLGKQR